MKPRHFIPALLLALLIAYPLSLGPLVRLGVQPIPVYAHGRFILYMYLGTRETGIGGFYQPIFWLGYKSPAIYTALDRYLKLWER